MKLRFINRKIPATMSDDAPMKYTIKVLQQWWEETAYLGVIAASHGEWRDVPLEME